VPHGFELQPVVSGPFDANPVGFAFLPDGRILILEKNTGNVRLATAGASTSTTIHTIPAVAPTYEGGLLGVAVDPAWPERPYLYFHVSRTNTVIQVLRYTGLGELDVESSSDLQLIDPYIVLGDLPDQQGIHQGGTLRFGPDGYLYVSIGDDGSPCDAQDRTRFNGKILRIDVAGLPAEGGGPPPKTVLAPPTNPYPAGGDNEALVYAYGFRNPFRFTIDSATGDLYVGDVGESTYEEVDELPSTMAGANFGWPEYEATLPDPVAGADTCSTGPFTAPVFEYLHSPTLQASIVCGPVVHPVAGSAFGFPPAYDGDLFVSEFFAGWIKRLVRGAGGWDIAAPVPGQAEWENWAVGLPAISDLQLGPDGALYFMQHLSGSPLERGLYRIIDTASTDAGQPGTSLKIEAFPNPMRVGADTVARFTFGEESASLCIFDAIGRRVWQARTHAGTAFWDGSTAGGERSGAGIYFYELETASGRRATGKLTRVP